MANDKEEQGKKMGEVIKKAWEDEAFMARLLEDATTVLAEEGIKLPEGMKVQAVTNTEVLSYLLIPPKPKTGLIDTELDAISGGHILPLCYFDHVCGGSGLDAFSKYDGHHYAAQ